MHCGSIRQTASILSMSKECLRTGDKALIHFRFIKHPEYMTPGQRMVFREGRTKAVGNVVRIVAQSSPSHQGNRAKQNKPQRYGGQGQQKTHPSGAENQDLQQEFPEITVSSTGEGTAFEGSTDKREGGGQKGGQKKGRSRRGCRKKPNSGAANVQKPLVDVANITNNIPRTAAKV